jgi:alanine racemase
LFVALKTDRGDGHDFIADALARGCAGALVDDGRGAEERHAWIIAVPDTFTALADYGRFIVRRRGLPVVAITGSVGKTGAREAVAAVLSRRYAVFRNPSNFNGRLGLSIALGGLEAAHQMLVLEMGTDAPGEIRDLCDIAPPQVGIVTNVSESHLAFFGSLDAIAQEKAALVEALPADGLAILNADDPRVWAMRHKTRARVIGARPDPQSSTFNLRPSGLAFAREAGRYFGIAEADIDAALERLPALPGRMRPWPGINGCWLIDDTFNANPASMRAAIEAVVSRESTVESRQPGGAEQPAVFLVLGDMDQLGDRAAVFHRDVGRFVAQRAAASPLRVTLIALGELARHIADAAIEAGMASSRVISAYLARDAAEHVRRQAGPGDVVLVKGDVSARLERLVAALLADPADKAGLARQEPGWESARVAKPARPTWLEVGLDAIAHNARRIKRCIGPDVALMAVLKADGYGHGAVKAARTALNNGASYCGVASLNEAALLRAAHIEEPILILGYTPAWHARDALLRDVAVTLYDLDVARAFSRAAQDLRRPARAHIKIDTGMGRLGVLPAEAPDFIRAVASLPGIEVEGLFTHFSCADTDPDFTRLQLDRFRQVVEALPPSVARPRILHAANSAAALAYPETRLNMVRVGLALYGLSPFSADQPPAGPEAVETLAALRPALAWKTTIAQVKTLPDGAPVSYGAAYRCQGERRIAVIPVGYADGFRRAPQHFGEVLVRGCRAPIVGRVCMDQTMIDVTGIPAARAGDEVALIGRQGAQAITAEDVAARLGTINYEVVSAILPRVPRVT